MIINTINTTNTEEKFAAYPSESMRQRIEHDLGIDIDWKEGDQGEDRPKGDYSHIISDPNNTEAF